MTAILSNSSFTTPLRASATSANLPLLARLSARVSCSLDEVAVFASPQAAFAAIASGIALGRGTVALSGTHETTLDALIAAARDAAVVTLQSPLLQGGRVVTALTPRELLLLRSRAPRPILVLDLLNEELARTPLTQPALLLPATIIVRGFGELWREAGATTLAELAFVVGPRELVASLEAPELNASTVARACEELDVPEIDRAVRAAAFGREALENCA